MSLQGFFYWLPDWCTGKLSVPPAVEAICSGDLFSCISFLYLRVAAYSVLYRHLQNNGYRIGYAGNAG